MSRSASLTVPDLFDYVPPAPAPRRSPSLRPTQAHAPDLGGLSDARLGRLLADLVREVERRVGAAGAQESRHDLDPAIRAAAEALAGLAPKAAKPARKRRGPPDPEPLQEPKRKAVRAALKAGVSPAQVAKHFGLPLSAVRRVLAGGR